MRSVVFCHCSLCRVQGSIATVGVARRSLRLIEFESLRSFDSSPMARRWFCGVCGAAIYWDPLGEPFVAIFAGSLDQPTGLDAMAHIYVHEVPDYYCIADDLHQYSGPMHPERNGSRIEEQPEDDDMDLGDEVEDTAVEIMAEGTAPNRRVGGSA